MIHVQIAVICCLLVAALGAPQGRYLPAQGGYGVRNANSIVQASALPRRFSVSKPASQANKYIPPSQAAGGYQGAGSSQYSTATRPQYQGGGTQYQGGGGKYQGGAAPQQQYSTQGGYGGGNQYRGSTQYTTEDPYAEPANYDFSYEVSAPEYNVQFGHQESRRDMFARGSYQVLLPDGRTQLVEYEADQEGYRPTITYQEAAGGRGGYGQGGGSGGYGQGGYSQGGNGGGGYSKGGSGGKSSYGQKNSEYSGGNGGYSGQRY